MRPSLEDVVFFHTVAVQNFGGSSGIRSPNALESAIARPWGVYFGREHFPSPFDKAAALCEALIRNHPFVDGNKRTAMYASAFLLERFGYELVAGQDEVENLAVEVAEGRYATEEIAGWFMEPTSKLEAT
jgi:death on curing protein